MNQRWVWLIAIVTFGVGDIVTTYVGLEMAGMIESNPFANSILQSAGFIGLIATKAIVICIAYVGWFYIPWDSRIGIPIGLATVGVPVTLWNSYLIAGVVL